jgi:HlyD family secretion protein
MNGRVQGLTERLPRKTMVRWGVIGGLGLLAALALALFLRPPALVVEAAAVTRGPIADSVADQGQARARQAYVVSAPFAGDVERLPVEVGDAAAAGRTVVARIRPAPLADPRARLEAEAAVKAAEAALSAAKAQRDAAAAQESPARLQAERTSPLVDPGAASRQEADNAVAAARAARLALAAADAVVDQRAAELASARAAFSGEAVPVLSPANGLVTRLLQQNRRLVAAGAPLVEVADRSGLEAAVEFLSQDAARIHPGDPAEIYDWGGPGTLSARVRLVEPLGFTKVSALGVEEQRALVILQLEGRPEAWSGLQPGYRVWGRVVLRRASDAVLAPTGALVRSGGGWAVWRIENDRARLRQVTVGILTDVSAQVLSGLGPGDRVVLYPSANLKDGSRVKAS